MKKILLVLFLAGVYTSLFAQSYNQPYYGFRLGLTAHPTIGFMKVDEGKGEGISLGFSYGLLGDFNFAENYSFSTGVVITTVNGKSTQVNPKPYHPSLTALPETYALKYKMQYIEVPLSLKLKTHTIGGLKWYGQFGLGNGFRIGAKGDAKKNNVLVADNVNASSWTRFYRGSILVGGGAEYDLDGKTSVMIGITVSNAFTNMTTDRANKARNHYVGMNIGLFF